MHAREGILMILVALPTFVGCQNRQASVDTEVRITELETQVSDLEAQLQSAWDETSRLSAGISSGLGGLELAISEVDRKILDLRGGDPQFTVPEVEAAVFVAKQRLAAVKASAGELAQFLEY
jgi:hypothetical protein